MIPMGVATEPADRWFRHKIYLWKVNTQDVFSPRELLDGICPFPSLPIPPDHPLKPTVTDFQSVGLDRVRCWEILTLQGKAAVIKAVGCRDSTARLLRHLLSVVSIIPATSAARSAQDAARPGPSKSGYCKPMN